MLKKSLQYVFVLLVAMLMVACGGGGGSASGSTSSSGSSSSSGSTTTSNSPTISLSLLSGGTDTSTINSTSAVTAQAIVKDASGTLVKDAIVTFSFDTSLIKVNGATSVLTNAAGSATVSVSPASVTAVGADAITAKTVISGVSYTASKNYQLGASSVVLSPLTGSGALAAYGTKLISVNVFVNGSTATTALNPIQVTFTADCGTMSPATVTTDSNGSAQTTYTANNVANNVSGCGGKIVAITASATGASPVPGTIIVQAAAPTNIQFVSATPSQIFLKNSVGDKQSVLRFKVVNQTGAAVGGVNVKLSLDNLSTGITIDTTTNVNPVIKTTDGTTGEVTVPVFSGTVPTSVQVKAELQSDSSVYTFSNQLKVNSGKAVQSRLSLALGSFSIAGYQHDGETTSLTMSLADRQGNPVLDGTVVTFVISHGEVSPGSCTTTGGSSQCAVTIRSSGSRPSDGIVTILGYAVGEEDFVDANGDNVYTSGETFTDLGNAFLDTNNDGIWQPGETVIPRVTATQVACSVSGTNSKAGTCDGGWSDTVDVRQQARMVWATDGIVIGASSTFSKSTGILIVLTDDLGNSIPTGSSIAASVVSAADSGCSVATTNPTSIPNTLGSTVVTLTLTSTCVAGDQFKLTVTSSKKTLDYAFTLQP